MSDIYVINRIKCKSDEFINQMNLSEKMIIYYYIKKLIEGVVCAKSVTSQHPDPNGSGLY